MTIGQLSRRTGVPIKVLREYEALGFLYTLGRSESNYRLFGEEAVWCVQVVQGLRSLGLTLKEIQSLTTRYREHPDDSIDGLLDATLAQARARVEGQIAQLEGLRERILEFQAVRTRSRALLPACSSAPDLARLLASDPRRSAVHPAS
jgi:DNA-binding transcriptional MerR regulator